MREEPVVGAMANWKDCAWARIRQSRALILTVESTTSILGTRPASTATLQDFVDRLGGSFLSAKAHVTRHAAPSATVVVTSLGLVILGAPGPFAAFAGVASPSNLPGEVDLIIKTPTATAPTALRMIQNAASHRRAIAMIAPVLDLRPADGRTPDLGSFTDGSGNPIPVPEPQTRVIIDQNLLVNMDRCLMGRRPDLWEPLRDLCGWLSICDCIPGFALAESSYGLQGASSAAHLQAAFKTFLEFASKPCSLTEAQAYYQIQAEQLGAQWTQRGSHSPLIAMNYVGVLKAAELWKQCRGRPFIPRERIDAYRAWIDYMNRAEVGIPGYCFTLVHHLFLSDATSGQDAQRLMKLGKEPSRQDLVGAAWDLNFLFFRDHELRDSSVRVSFFTADRALLSLTSLARLVEAGTVDGHSFGTIHVQPSTSTRFGPRQTDEIAHLHARLSEDQAARRLSPGPDPEFLDSCITTLERALGLEPGGLG